MSEKLLIIKAKTISENHLTNADGDILFNAIHRNLEQGAYVVVSFKGLSYLNSSYINSALIQLLNHHSFETIKENVSFVDSTRQINTLIKNSFHYQTTRGEYIQ